jgi:hypothetical protein
MLDEKVLDEARRARQRLVDLESQTAHARIDYHDAIKALHADGGSLREIAEALELSHQRVHQIVEGAPDPRGLAFPRWFDRSRRRQARNESAFARFDDDARQMIPAAHEEAEQLKHGYIGTEHLLLALVRRGTGGLEVPVDAVRGEVVARVGEGSSEERGRGRLPFTAQAKLAIDGALKAAAVQDEGAITADDLLLAVAASEGTGRDVLHALGFSHERLRERLGRDS